MKLIQMQDGQQFEYCGLSYTQQDELTDWLRMYVPPTQEMIEQKIRSMGGKIVEGRY